MALIQCPKCGGTISDKAKMCPHCGERRISYPNQSQYSTEEVKLKKNFIENKNQEQKGEESTIISKEKKSFRKWILILVLVVVASMGIVVYTIYKSITGNISDEEKIKHYIPQFIVEMDETNSISLPEELIEMAEDKFDLFGLDGRVDNLSTAEGEKQGVSDLVVWSSLSTCSEQDESQAQSVLTEIYGQPVAEGTDVDLGYMVPFYTQWNSEEYDFIICGLNTDKKLVVAWYANLGAEKGEGKDVDEDVGNVESLDSLEKINKKKLDIISNYKTLFDSSGVPYEILPNEEIIVGTETSYQILDVDYSVGEFVSSIYYPNDNVIKTGFNLTIDYHEEKGLDKENPHVKLLYNVLAELGAYTSMDDMIFDIENNYRFSNGTYAWENTVMNGVYSINFACFEQINCDYDIGELNFASFDNLDSRNSKMEEYMNLVDRRLSESGFADDSVVRTQVRDGWENDSYARDIDNDLGIVVRFNEIDTSAENIGNAIKIVKIYIDSANEIFDIQIPYSSEVLARDIVSRARLVRYNKENGVFRMRPTIDFPCNELLDQYINPIDTIQYTQSGYFIDSLGWYSDEEGTIIIEYYIPIKVEGLKSKY